MIDSFLIVISGESSCALSRAGETGVQKFTSVDAAISDARKTLRGTEGDITIADMMGGETRIVKLASARSFASFRA